MSTGEDLQAALKLVERLARDLEAALAPDVRMALPKGHVLAAVDQFLWRIEGRRPVGSVLDGFAQDIADAVTELAPRLTELEQHALRGRLAGEPAVVTATRVDRSEAAVRHATDRALATVRLLALDHSEAVAA